MKKLKNHSTAVKDVTIILLMLSLTVLCCLLVSCSSETENNDRTFYIDAAKRAVKIELDDFDYRFCSNNEYELIDNGDKSWSVKGYVDCTDDEGKRVRKYFSVIIKEGMFDATTVIWG